MNEQEKKTKVLSPKENETFREIFGKVGNEEIVKNFLESVMQKEISEIDLSNNAILSGMPPDEICGLVDVVTIMEGQKKSFEICILDGNIFNGVQLNNNLIPWYGAYIYAKLAEKNREPKRVTYIFISEYNIEGIQREDYHTSWSLMSQEGSTEILGYSLNFHLIEIPKMKEAKWDEEDKLKDWIFFLENPEEERVREKMKTNSSLKKAYEEYQRICQEKEEQEE